MGKGLGQKRNSVGCPVELGWGLGVGMGLGLGAARPAQTPVRLRRRSTYARSVSRPAAASYAPTPGGAAQRGPRPLNRCVLCTCQPKTLH